MPKDNIKKSIFSKIRNNFIAGVVVLIPIGITVYLTLFIVRISGVIIPKEINPNNYLPFNIPGVEILIALFLITFIGWLSLSKTRMVPSIAIPPMVLVIPTANGRAINADVSSGAAGTV